MNSSDTYCLSISGMDCPNCAAKIERSVRSLDGVQEASVDFLSQTLRVTGPDSGLLIRHIRSLGYTAQLLMDERRPPHTARREPTSILRRRRIVEVLSASLLIALSGMGEWLGGGAALYYLFLFSGMIVGGYPIARKGWLAARRLELDMNFLMSIASIGAVIIGESLEGGTVIVLFAIAELLEDFSVDRSRQAVRKLMELKPQQATVIRDNREITLAAQEVQIGETILVKPGAAIPLDGIVVSGASAVNQAAITGESLPVDKGVEDELLAGTINGEGALIVRVTQASGNTTLDRIVRLVERAQAEKAPMQRLVERFARYYTPLVVGLAVLTAVVPPLLAGVEWSEWIYRALALLVIACPCALVISTPVTVVSALAGAARKGVLIKGGVYLEHLHRITTWALDKTGTVTEGALKVTAIHPLNGITSEQLLQIAASIEAHSEHPVARAIVERAYLDSVQWNAPDHFTALPGKGASAELNGRTIYAGNHVLFEELNMCDATLHQLLEQIEDAQHTAVMIGNAQRVEGIIAVADTIRPHTSDTVRQLRWVGVKHISLLTGDNHRTAEAVGRSITVDEVRSHLLPQDKVEAVRRLKRQYGSVVMVGDGVNDTPALAAADIGIAMGGTGTDAAMETADVVLIADRIERLPWLVRLSRKTHRIIVANIIAAIGIKFIFILLAATGNATLWMALFADMGVSLLVIGNGLRALRSR